MAAAISSIPSGAYGHLARDGLNLTEARLLRRVVVAGSVPKELSNSETVALGVLVNAGLVELGAPTGPSASRAWVAAPAVLSSLAVAPVGQPVP